MLIVVYIIAGAIVLRIAFKLYTRSWARRLARERFYAGRCVKCDQDLRMGKEVCPRCGRTMSWIEAKIWEDALERCRRESAK